METTSNEPPIKEGSLGSYLKNQREMRQISHNEIARVTKINVGILKALEEDDYNRLPAPPFVKGFLTSIGKYLGLDTHDLLLRYEQILETSPTTFKNPLAPAKQPTRQPVATPTSQTLTTPKSSAVKSTAAPQTTMTPLQLKSSVEKWLNRKTIPVYITVILAAVVLTLLRSAGRPKSQVATLQPPVTRPESETSPPTPPLPGKTEAPPVPSASELEKTSLATTPAQPTTPEATEAAKPVEAKVEKAPTLPSQEPAPLPTPKEQEVVISAKIDTFVKVKIGSQPISGMTIRGGESLTLKSMDKMKLQILNAGSVTLVHNSKKLGRPGPWGKDVILEFPSGP